LRQGYCAINLLTGYGGLALLRQGRINAFLHRFVFSGKAEKLFIGLCPLLIKLLAYSLKLAAIFRVGVRAIRRAAMHFCISNAKMHQCRGLFSR